MSLLRDATQRYINSPFWLLFIINTLLYAGSIYVEYHFILTDDYNTQFLKPLFNSEEDYLEALNKERLFEIYNYLWSPVHVLIQLILTSFCLFIGFNAINRYLSFKNSLKVTMLALIVFPINNLIVTILQASKVINCTPNTIDDLYFFQSIGRFFVKLNLPNTVYRILEIINIVEFIFCLFAAFVLSPIIMIKYKKTLLEVIAIYSIGTLMYVFVLQFCDYLFT